MNVKSLISKVLLLPKSATFVLVTALLLSPSLNTAAQICPPNLDCSSAFAVCPPSLDVTSLLVCPPNLDCSAVFAVCPPSL